MKLNEFVALILFAIAVFLIILAVSSKAGVVPVPFEIGGPEVDSVYMQVWINGKVSGASGYAAGSPYIITTSGRWTKAVNLPWSGYLNFPDTANSVQIYYRVQYPGELLSWQDNFDLKLSAETSVVVWRRETSDADSIWRYLFAMVNTPGSATDTTPEKFTFSGGTTVAQDTITFLPDFVHLVRERWYFKGESQYAIHQWQPPHNDSGVIYATHDTIGYVFPSVAAKTCNVAVVVINSSGAPVPNVKLHAYLERRYLVDSLGQPVLNRTITRTTDSSGVAIFPCLWSSYLVPETKWKIMSVDPSLGLSRSLTVPRDTMYILNLLTY